MMDRVRFVLPKVLAKRGLKEHAVGALVTHKAQQFLTHQLPALADTFSVTKLDRGTLVITVTHSIAAQECQQLSGRLCEYLKAECPDATVLEVRVMRSGEAKK